MICLYNKNETDFSSNGLCVLTPTVCTVEEVAGGEYELYMEHPIDDAGKTQLLLEDMLIKAPVPPMVVPEIVLPDVMLWATNKATNLYSKLPIDGYSKSTSADIERVKKNPNSYKWRSGLVYQIGILCVYNNNIYRCKEVNYSCAPSGNPALWGFVCSINSVIQTYDPGVVAENLSANEQVTFIADYSAQWVKVRSLRGVTGYVRREDCDNEHQIQPGEVIPSHEITEQVFRIYNIEAEDDQRLICVNARHISYDFQGNSLYECNIQEADPITAISILQGSLMVEDDRRILTNITDKTISQDWSFKNPINALLDQGSGFVVSTGAKLIRDNKNFFLLDGSDLHKGIALSYGVNLRGVKWTRSVEDVITRVVPRCSDSADGYLYIEDGGAIVDGSVRNDGKMWVDSPIASEYPFARIEVLDCKYSVGEKYEKPDGEEETRTKESCQQSMKEDALNRFLKDAVDGVRIELEVDFVLLGDTEQYKQYKGLQRVNIYDIISINTGFTNVASEAQIIEYEYDCIMKRYNSVKLGTVNSFQRRIPGYRVVNQSITYEKLSPDLINRIKTMNASGSTSSGSGTSGSSSPSEFSVDRNTKDVDGIVTKGQGQANKVWKTDADGNPDWRDDSGGITVVDNLTSTSTTDALSAKQGKVLNDQFVNHWGKGYGNSQNPIADLADLPVNGGGIVTMAASLSPTGSASMFSFEKLGNANRYTVKLTRIRINSTYESYIGEMYDGTFLGWIRTPNGIVDNLTSTRATDALSANQGKVLNEKINSAVPSKVMSKSGVTHVFTIPSNFRGRIDGVTSNNNRCFSILVNSYAAGDVYPITLYKGSSVTLDTSVANKLTVTLDASSNMQYMVFASSKDLLDGVT